MIVVGLLIWLVAIAWPGWCTRLGSPIGDALSTSAAERAAG